MVVPLQESQVDTFIEVSDWKGTREEAQARLEATNGNVELALSLLFEEGADPIPAPPRVEQPRPHPHRRKQRSLMEELSEEYTRDLVRNVAPRVTPMKKIYQINLSWPWAFVNIFDFLLGMLYELAPQALRSTTTTPPREANSAHFNSVVLPHLASTPTGEIPTTILHNGESFADAMEIVKSKLGYMLVVVTSDIHEVSPARVVQNVLQLDLVTQGSVYLWFGNAQTIEGLSLIDQYGAERLPYIALISPSPKTANSSTIVMEKLLESHGNVLNSQAKRNEVDAQARRVIEDHEPRLISLRLERGKFDSDRELRKQQDEAYQRSLAMDKQRAEEAKVKQAETQSREAKFKSRVRRAFERAAALDDAPAKTGARLCLRLPDGHRLNFTIPEESPVSDVYDYAYTRIYPSALDDLDQTKVPEDSDTFYGFNLVSTITRNSLPADETPVRNIESAWPSGVFMVDIL